MNRSSTLLARSALLGALALGASTAFAATKEITLRVPTMDCATCPITIRAALLKVPGVRAAKVSYEQLVDWFWRNIDPSQAGGQFCDHGSSYRSAIFVHHEAQRKVAEDTKRALEASGRIKQAIVTEIVAAGAFYEAEDYHQDYYKKNPNRYRFYKFNCGRVQRLEEIWGKATPPPNLTR